MASSRPTTRSLAAELGVSANTVSKALRGATGVSGALSRKIQAHARRRGYRCDAFASRFMSHLRRKGPGRFSTTIAWLNEWPEPDAWEQKPHLRGFWTGALSAAERLGCRLDSIHLPALRWNGARLEKILHARGIEALILPASKAAAPNCEIDWSPFALVAMANARPHLCIPRVNFDMLANLRRIHEQCSILGLTRVGTVRTCWRNPPLPRTDYAIFSTAVHGEEGFFDMAWETEEDRVRFLRWVKRRRLEAIITNSATPRKWCREAGIDVPAKLALFHLDVMGQTNPPEWAGIDNCATEIGSIAVHTVTSNLLGGRRGLAEFPTTILIGGVWRWGGGIGPDYRTGRP